MARGDSSEEELMHHVPQHRRQPQQTSSLDSSPPPQHPFNLDFPTLEDDGSVPDLAALHSSVPPQYSTPPAALSALGTRAAMADRSHEGTSKGSIADQYDIIDPDDLSEMSNDDHDTASIASTEQDQDGCLTPEHAASDDEDELKLDEWPTYVRPHSSTESMVKVDLFPARRMKAENELKAKNELKAENELIDSYMSEDLETPRQSTMPFPAAGPAARRPTLKSSKATPLPHHILFVSGRDQAVQDMDLILSRITAAMQSGESSTSDHKVVRLPPTPACSIPASATVICSQDSVSATVQHCVDVKRRSFGACTLAILDHNGENVSWFVVGPDGQVDGHKPDLAVFYLRNREDSRNSKPVLEAVKAMKVASVTLIENEIWDICSPLPSERNGPNVVIKASEFISMERPALSMAINKATATSGQPKAQAKASGQFTPISRVMSLAMGLPLILLLIASFFSHMPGTLDVAARREALSMSIAKVPGVAAVSNNTNAIDLEHLLPTLPALCYRKTLFGQGQTLNTTECAVEARFQPLQPNHMVISIPGSPHVVSTDVQKSDGRKVTFNTTRLIEGVSLITFDPNEMYDTVTVVILTERPSKNITASHYYGKRFLQRRTYKQAGTEVGKKVGSDIAVISKRAQKINRVLSNKVTESTRNFTSALIKYVTGELQVVSRELQLMRKIASSMLPPLAKIPTTIRKDIVKYTHDLSGSVKSTMEVAKSSTKALVRTRLILSRERLLALQQALRKKREGKQARKPKIGASQAIQARAAKAEEAKIKAKQQLQKQFDSGRKPGDGLQTAPKQQREAVEECRKSNSEQHYWF